MALVSFVGLCLLACDASRLDASDAARLWPESLAWPRLALGWMPDAIHVVLTLGPGFAAWLVWRRIDVAAFRKRAALRAWGWLVLASAAWPSLLVGLRSTGLGVVGLAIVLAAGIVTVRRFWALDRGAALIVLPSLVWAAVSAYITFGGWWMDRV